MKKLHLIVAFIFCIGSLFAQTQYEQANSLYANGNFEEAIKVYNQILETKGNSADAHYNLANAYYKTNKIADAILHYEKALKLDPSNEDAKHNLQFANAKTVDKIEATPQLAINSGWKNLVLSKSVDGWATLTLTLTFLSVLFLIVYLFMSQLLIKKLSFFLGIVLIIVSAFTFILAASANNYITNSKEAIIYAASVNTHSEPNKSSTKLFTLHQGTKVQLLSESENWVKIKLPNGSIGWLQKTEVREI
jgi:tetratricopeptide (TPR) repeat protein